VRSRASAFTGMRLPHPGQALAVGFSGFMRESTSAMEGSPVPASSSSTESSISDMVMPSRKCLSAWRRAISSKSSFSEYCFSPFFRILRAMPGEDHASPALSIFRNDFAHLAQAADQPPARTPRAAWGSAATPIRSSRNPSIRSCARRCGWSLP